MIDYVSFPIVGSKRDSSVWSLGNLIPFNEKVFYDLFASSRGLCTVDLLVAVVEYERPLTL